MLSTKSVKQRIKSVRNISQITKAMEVVSATKMRRSQEFALRARPYAVASLEMLKNLISRAPVLPPLLQSRPVNNSALLVVTSDKGLAGAFNANVLKKAEAWVREKKNNGASFSLVAVGKKAKDYFERRGIAVEKNFWGFGDFNSIEQTLPVSESILNGFLGGRYDEVETVYTNFRTTLLQETALKRILPVSEAGIEETVRAILPEQGRFADSDKIRSAAPDYTYEYTFEPSPAEILNSLVPQLIQMHIHHIILESNASEHSARMVAMKNASENAGELISKLSLIYNKARQAGITRELTEITAGKEALQE